MSAIRYGFLVGRFFVFSNSKHATKILQRRYMPNGPPWTKYQGLVTTTTAYRIVIGPPGEGSDSGLRGSTNEGGGKSGRGGSGGGRDGQLCCPKCGNPCTHVETFVSSTRFVKCEKCHHFFVVLSDVDSKKTLKENRHMGNEKAGIQRKPPPPPKKVTTNLYVHVIKHIK
ncbi:ATP-dependent Clp protease ATP-binding subunit clpX-like, mitochondrial [Limulus polyphemus]|uniref:ATP-dependent Clp protease ATP-binding subunit clpX-like, mitochondrial n=1 Tax=Limulus polyphemus TaxID=6850 RepID=A0ABM1BI62_LIMPO|nr:ATP-dependent Clp protease ATP-binding subunit clpX-like, mitochondrial [Limulus polyphemus]